MMVYKIFVVFAFKEERVMELFKRSNLMDYVADKTVAMMDVSDAYKMTDVVELFEDIYPCYLIYELTDGVVELVLGKNLRRLDAS